jgi:hypothetical protein
LNFNFASAAAVAALKFGAPKMMALGYMGNEFFEFCRGLIGIGQCVSDS